MTEITLIIEEDIHEYWTHRDQKKLLNELEDVLQKKDLEIYDSTLEGD